MIQKVLSKWNRKWAVLLSGNLMPRRWGADSCCPRLLTVKVERGRHVFQLGARVRARARYKEKSYFFLECALYAYLYWGNQLFLLTSQEEEQVLAYVPGQSYSSQLALLQSSQLSISVLEEQLWQSPWPCLEISFPLHSKTKLIWNGWVNLTFFLRGTCVHMKGGGSPGGPRRST